MIILEGPDASGKTTLAEYLCDNNRLDYMRNPYVTSSDGALSTESADWADQYLSMTGREHKPLLFDRWFYISEMVYQLATPGRELLVDAQRLAKGLVQTLQQAHFIFCNTPWSAQEQTLSDDNRLHLHDVDRLQLQKISWGYWGIYELVKEAAFDKATWYDYTSHSLRNVDDFMEEYFS